MIEQEHITFDIDALTQAVAMGVSQALAESKPQEFITMAECAELLRMSYSKFTKQYKEYETFPPKLITGMFERAAVIAWAKSKPML